MTHDFGDFEMAPIHEKDAWRLCDFMIINSDRFKNDFPETLAQNSTPSMATYFAQKKAKQFAAGEEYLFTIKDQKDRKIIGLIYVKELGKKLHRAELAYCIGKAYEGQGNTSRFLEQVIAWCFGALALHTLQIIAHKDNLASTGVARKLGFAWQETLPNAHTRAQGERVDMELYEKYRSA